MIVSGWLVCSTCEGTKFVYIDEGTAILCPRCDGTGDPQPGDFEEDEETQRRNAKRAAEQADSDEDLFDHWTPAEELADDARRGK
jgi:hypothetical protein